jgi:hypothetical protein
MRGLYLGLVLLGVVGGVSLHRLVKEQPGLGRVAAWMSLAAGAAFLAIYALASDPDAFCLVICVLGTTTGVHGLRAGRLQEHIGGLEQQVQALRSRSGRLTITGGRGLVAWMSGQRGRYQAPGAGHD